MSDTANLSYHGGWRLGVRHLLGPPLRAIVRVFDAAGTLGLAAGISVHSRSGRSRFVVANYDFGPASQHYLCGNTDVPPQADRVFAGA